jgi:hypothetical protein
MQDSNEKRNKLCAFRVTPAEHAHFKDQADTLGIDLSTWIRMVCRIGSGLATADHLARVTGNP